MARPASRHRPVPPEQRGMPALADGSIPQPGDRVTHPDGTAGVIAWTVFGTYHGPHGAVHDTWVTVVQHEVPAPHAPDGIARSTRTRLTAELHPASGAPW